MSMNTKILAAFVGLYMVGFSGLAVFRGNTEFIFYGVVMLLIIGGIVFMHMRVSFSAVVLWGLALWGLAHMAGGNVPVPLSLVPDGATAVLYNLKPASFIPKYDQLTHALGFGFATLAAWEAMRTAIGPGVRPSLGLAIAIACVGMGLGAVNEVVEFAAEMLVPDTNVGGYINTGWDLVSNMVGTTAAATWIWLTAKPLQELTEQA